LIDLHARSAGLDGISAQMLRHTCAKNLLRKKNVRHVAKFLGHQNVKALEKYASKQVDQ